MAKTDLSVKIGAEYVGKAAFNAAEKSIKKLGKQTAALISGGGILAFGRSSVQAFYESEKSAKALYGTIRNLGLAFQQDEINKYVDKLSLATGIVDNRLNPALQVLLLNTRNVAKSQQLLNVALDISAATGVDLQQTSLALGKAYAGNRAALGKLNLGFTQAELNAKDFNDVLRLLSYTFEGQAAAAAEGFTGDMDKMNIVIKQFKTAVGGGIAKGLTDSAGDINKTAVAITKLGEALGKYIEISLKYTTQNIGALLGEKLRAQFTDRPSSGFTYSLGSRATQDIADSRTRRLEAQRLKVEKQQLATQQKLLKTTQDQAKIKKSQGILDIEQAGVLAALQGKISENERLRLELQLALLTGNAKEADRLSNELLMSQARTTGLATFIANLPKALNPFADYPAYVLMALAELAKLAEAQKNLAKPTVPMATAGYSPTAGNLMNPFVGDYAKNYGAFAESPFTPYSGNPNPTVYNYTINGATQGLLDELNNGLINNSASGNQSSINRTRFGQG
jgi:hypothetical protein